MKKMLKIFVPAIAAVICLLAGAGVAAAKDVSALAVLSFDNPVYRETLAGFKNGAAAKGSEFSITEYVMAGDEKEAVIDKKYDVIFAIGSKAQEAVKKAAGKTPVVFCMVFTEQKTGAGVTLSIPADVKLKKIREFLPARKKIGVIYTEESKTTFNQVEVKAEDAGFKVAGKLAASADEFEGIFGSMAKSIDCYLMLPDTSLYTSGTIKNLFSTSMENKVPVIGLSSVYTKAGAYMSFDYDYNDIGKQAGELAAGIASGKETGKVVSPRKITISLNSAAAGNMGIDISGVSAKANQVY